MMNWRITPIAVSIHAVKDNPLFGESVTRVSLETEAGSEPFFVLQQFPDGSKPDEIRLAADELKLVLKAGLALLKTYPRSPEGR